MPLATEPERDVDLFQKPSEVGISEVARPMLTPTNNWCPTIEQGNGDVRCCGFEDLEPIGRQLIDYVHPDRRFILNDGNRNVRSHRHNPFA